MKKKTIEKKLKEDLRKRYANTYKFLGGDIYKFRLELGKGDYQF